MSASSRSVLRKKTLHVFVLDGPLNHTVESLLASSVVSNQKVGNRLLSASEVGTRSIVSVPTGELLRLGADVRIVLEATEVAHLSPSVLTAMPLLTVSFSRYVQGSEQSARAAGKLSVKRIVTAWIRSLYNWLGDFTPWLGTLDELHKVPSYLTYDELTPFLTYLFGALQILLGTQFIEELICDDFSSFDLPAMAIVCKLSCFLRYLVRPPFE